VSGINVLSLFDGMSCGHLALERSGIKTKGYFASEIDKYAMKVTNHNFPDTVQLGDINNYKSWDIPVVELAIAGSPCQDLSRIKAKEGKGLLGEKSKLFFKYAEVIHKFKPKHFLLENVLMDQESQDIITATLGVEPIEINSSHFSAQDRRRLYWTNIDFDKELPNSELVLKDIMESDVDPKYFYDDELTFNGLDKRVVANLNMYYPNGKRKFTETLARVYNPEFKSPTLTAVCGGHQEKKVWDNGKPRKLTPLEYERLQTIPHDYTGIVSNSQRYKMLGNGWTVDVIAHILKGLPY
jgi:DNA-cytosine methyltransferase